MHEFEFATWVRRMKGTAYRVGGSIRNQILGLPAKDRDYCVTGLTKNDFLEMFPTAAQVGNSFPVFLLKIDNELCEIAFARKERKVGQGHKSFEADFGPGITITEDLLRRDFTMNAIAYDILEGKVIDPYNGTEDIHKKIIRATSDAFIDDPLRIYRAARFAAQLGFKVSTQTINMSKNPLLHEDMQTLSAERVCNELNKALWSDHPELFFNTLLRGHCLHVHFKEIYDLVGVPQPALHHPEGHAYIHTMQVLSEMCKLTDKVERRFAALTHDLGKARTPQDKWPKHHGHEELGVEPLHALCDRLKLPNKWRHAAHFGVNYHGRFHFCHKMRHVKIVDFVEAARRSTLGIEGIAQLGLADARGRNGLHQTHTNYEPFMRWGELISQVKGNPELEGLKAKDDKRKRQAALIRADMKEEQNA